MKVARNYPDARWIGRCLARFALTALSAWMGYSAAFAAPSQATGARVKDFQAPARDKAGKKSLITGKDARPVSDTLMEIFGPKVQTYKADETLDLIVEAPQCFYEMKTKAAYSSGELTVKTADGRFSIQGKGFRWEPSSAKLFISNQVQALISGRALEGSDLAGSKNNSQPARKSEAENVQVMSEKFEYEDGAARFERSVRVVEKEGTLHCEILLANFAEAGGKLRVITAEGNVRLEHTSARASGQKARYDMQNEVLELEGQTTWRVQEIDGASERFWLDRKVPAGADPIVRAEQQVVMRLPVKEFISLNSSASKPTNDPPQVVQIESSLFRFETNAASFSGGVIARQGESHLASATLQALFAGTNRTIARVEADGQILLRQGDEEVKGDRAVYDEKAGALQIIGRPSWKMKDVAGSSEQLTVYPKKDAFEARENVRLALEGASTAQFQFGFNQRPAAPGTNMVTIIRSRELSHEKGLSLFSGGVTVSNAQGSLRCDTLTAQAGSGGKVEILNAEKNVLIEQPELTATGQNANYNLVTGMVELSGAPMLRTVGKTLRAESFELNRGESTFKIRGRYRIELDRAKLQKPGS